MSRILIIEDDESLRRELIGILELDGYEAQATRGFFDDSDPSWKDEYAAYGGDMAKCMSSRSDSWDNVVRASAQVDYWKSGVRYQALLDQIHDAEQMLDPATLDAAGKNE